jgi:hypothetical protein
MNDESFHTREFNHYHRIEFKTRRENLYRGPWNLEIMYKLMSMAKNSFSGRLIEGNAKSCHLKNLACKRTLRQVFIYRDPEPHTPLPPYTLYSIRVYSILIHTGRGGGELNQTLYLQSINTCPRSPFTGQYF